jgi:phosphoribosylformylglycinamidine synthase I
VKVAVLQFPGSNCDQDALWSLRDDLGYQAEYVWHESDDLKGFDAAFVPGGFTYGDYLRCGAIASQSPILGALKEFAKNGNPVIGVCNGFQILCEARLLPGALLLNGQQKFVCKTINLKAANRTSPWTRGAEGILRVPVAHGEGRYVCDAETLKLLQDRDLVAFLYVDQEGNPTPESNPNGSTGNIAGVLNLEGNVLGMMPHPERATRNLMGSSDGLVILRALELVQSGYKTR